MKTYTILAGVAALSLGTASPVLAQSAGHILRGAGIGAAGGAVVGAVVPGLSVGEGALIGGAGGAALNAINGGHKHRRYRDRNGSRYWIDKHGRRHYN